jgi:hypothetical protein
VLGEYRGSTHCNIDICALSEVHQFDITFVNVVHSDCILSKYGKLSFNHPTLLESAAENDSANISIKFNFLFFQFVIVK